MRLYELGTNDEKSELVALFTSNWQVNQKTIDFTALAEAKLVAEGVKNAYGARNRSIPRTWDGRLPQLTEILSRRSTTDPKAKFRGKNQPH